MAGTEAQDEVRAVFDQLLEAMNAGDAQRVRSVLSERRDAVHIGTDAEEWWTSGQVADAAAAGGGGDIQVIADEIEIHVLGNVAWAEARGRFTRVGGGARPARMTSVFAREDERWKVVQSHASLGVPNAEMFD